MQRDLFIRLFVGLLLLSAFAACSPEKKVQRYSYLFNDRKPTTRPTKTAPAPTPDPVSVNRPAPKQEGTLSIEDNHEELASSGIMADRQIAKVIKTAQSYIGTRYKYGGMSRKGMDCSGLVCTAYGSVNRQLPRSSSELAQSGRTIPRKKIQPGDLVFFSAKNSGRIDHVGLVTGVRNEQVEFIHSTTSNGVRADLLDSAYWDTRFRKAVRP